MSFQNFFYFFLVPDEILDLGVKPQIPIPIYLFINAHKHWILAQGIRPQTLNRQVPGSNLLAAAVVPLGKALYHCLVPQEGLNPILTGLFESKFLLGGGGSIWPPLQISAPKGAIAAKFCMDVKTHLKSIATIFFWTKTVYLLYYYNLCKLDASNHKFINISNK